jgi:GTPase SAR1 family protein
MGACLSGAIDGKTAKASRNIDKLINQGYVLESEKIKLLLLGAGESGKSTIFKQMRVLFGAPLTEDEKNQITPVVYSNTIASMKLLVQAALDMGYLEKISPENKESFELIQSTPESAAIDISIGNAIKNLWNDEGILLAWNRRSEFQIVESVKYYFNEIDRIKEEDYVATQQDLLLARVRTSGIVTEKYVIDGKNFEMYDVGGQRNERKKWIHCFDDVTAVIFVAALSEYDQVLFEDSSTNRMDEAIQLFDEICNTDVFQSSNMILFLNKKDLFQEKIQKVHIGDQEAFTDFDTPFGSDNYYDNGVKYFLQKFLAKNKNADRMVYSHVTCATDSQNVEIVFNSCKDIILRGNLAEEGI